MKKWFYRFLLVCAFIVTLIIIYNVIDNNRIAIVKEEVIIKDLPESFNDFKILQITDLHGETFGSKNKKLASIINNLDYDMIAITGDIQNKHSDNIDPFLDLVDGIENKDNIFFIFGNVDDKKYYEQIKNSGCNMLEDPVKITRGNDHIWINEYIYGEALDADATSIGLTHVPIPEESGYDLILAGHYHGGQYRIPFIGALFIPEPNGNGLFPDQKIVKGMQDFDSYKMYVSGGLSASSDNKLLEFRFFNTPEINIINLKSGS